jgi:hypothetical protein
MSGNGYPFVSKRDVARKLDADAGFVRFAIELLHRRFVERDRIAPPAGWMASDRKRGEEIYERLSSTNATAADIAAAVELAKCYARQIASHLRSEAIASDPRLAGAATVFGVRVPDQLLERWDDDPYPTDESERAAAEEAAAEDARVAASAEPAVVAAAEESGSAASAAEALPSSTSAGTDDAPPARRRGRPKGSRNRVKLDSDAKPKKRRKRP